MFIHGKSETRRFPFLAKQTEIDLFEAEQLFYVLPNVEMCRSWY